MRKLEKSGSMNDRMDTVLVSKSMPTEDAVRLAAAYGICLIGQLREVVVDVYALHAVAFEDLPADWLCPRCKPPKDKYNRA